MPAEETHAKSQLMMKLLLTILGVCSLAATTAEGSSQYRSSRSSGARDSFPFSVMDDDSSSHFMSSSFDEEERVISALERLEESDEGISGLSYRPKARPGFGTMYEAPPQPRHLDDRRSANKHTARKVEKRRRKVVSKAATSPVRNNDDDVSPGAENSLERHASSSAPLQKEIQGDSLCHDVSGVVKRSPQEIHTVSPSTSSIKPAQSGYPAPPKPATPHHKLTPSIHSNRGTGPATAVVHHAVSSTTPWVRRYLNARPKDVLLPVPKEYIADGFNLAQLAPIVERIGFQVLGAQAVDIAKRLVELPSPQPSYPIYRLALQLLLNENEAQEAMILQHPLIPQEAIQQAAEALYLLVHARFITSPRGLDALRRILLNSPVFGKCPRIQCEGSTLLPYGAQHDYTSNAHTCQRYCPSCGNLWNCWESKTDGCAWGPSLCYLLLLAHGHELYPVANRPRLPPLMSTDMIHHPNNPSIFGFQIHPAATWGRPLTS